MNKNPLKVILTSLIGSYLLSLLLLFGLALLSYKLRLPESQISIIIYAVYVTACLAGGLIAGKSIRQRRFFWGMLFGIAYFVILFLVSWLSAKNAPDNLNQILTVMGMCVASGTLGGMLS